MALRLKVCPMTTTNLVPAEAGSTLPPGLATAAITPSPKPAGPINGRGFIAAQRVTRTEAAEQFRAAISDAGLHPPAVIEADGKLHRFASNGKRGDDAGWYVFHGDGVPAGAFGDLRNALKGKWRANIGRRLSPQEESIHRMRVDAMRREREADDAKRKVEARQRAAEMWQSAQPAPEDHPYLRQKGVKANGLRVHDGKLVIPMYDGDGVHSLQFIAPNGDKKFLPGGRVSGCCHIIGKPSDVICVAEGYATGASIHEATGYAVAIAFNAGNLPPVARYLSSLFSDLRLIVCADDDSETRDNPGLTKAREAAQAVGGRLAVPDFGTPRPEGASDFNDLYRHAGADAVRNIVERALKAGLEGEVQGTGPQSLFAPLPKAGVFPVECLGDELGQAAAAIADRVQAPLPIAGVSVLAAAAVATQALRDVELPTGETKPLSGFFVSVAASGERKSTVDRIALNAVARHEDELRREHAPQLKLHIRRKKSWEAACNRILKPTGKERQSVEEIDRMLATVGPEPEPPLEPMMLCPEPTFEGLIKLMQVGQPSMGLFADEGGQFVGGFGMSPDHKLKTGAALSSAWDGKAIKRVRAGDGAVTLHGRRLSVHLMMQHQVSTAFLSDEQLTDQGLLSRVLVTAPDSIAGTRWWRDPTDEGQGAIARYEEKLLEILRHPLPLAKDTKNELTPPKLPFSADAKALYVTFVDEVEAQLGAEGSLRPICGFANKLPEHASRLAAVLAVFEDPAVEQLPGQAMARGIRLANFFAGELMRLKMAGWLDPTVAKAERLRLWVRDSWKEDHISVRAITQYAPPEFRKAAAENKRLVAILAEHGWLVPEPAGARLKEERAREAWRVVRDGGPP